MRTLRQVPGILTILAFALTGMIAGPQAVAAHSEHQDVVGHVYVNDNTAPVNTIAGFDRHADGTLTPLPGSPFTAGGMGAGSIIGSQGALQLSSNGRFLLAVDAGSNQISVLRVHDDGSLQPVHGSPFSSGGTKPVSIAVHDDLVYVANTGAGGSNYTGFRLGDNGRLQPIDGSTFSLPDSAMPVDVLFNSTGTRLAGIRDGTSMIDSFVVDDGLLTPAPSSPIPAQTAGPFGSEFRPTNPSQLFVSNAHAGAGAGTVSAFSVSSNATLTSIGASPFADNQTAPCWVEISHDGKFLFMVNTASETISSYMIASDGSLSLLGSTPIRDLSSNLRPFDARLDPTGKFLYIVDAGHATVSAFSVNGGSLTELASSPFALPGGATPFGIVVDGNT